MIITKTTRSAIRALQYLARQPSGHSQSPGLLMAHQLGESPSYLAKILRDLVKAGILHAKKGAHGGVSLGRTPSEITLLDIVEACQGRLVPDHCRPLCVTHNLCGYHRAAAELETALIGILSRWTLARLIDKRKSSKTESAPECLVLHSQQRIAPTARGER